MEFTDQDYELLSAYLDGDLSTGERAALEARLVAEPLLQRELAALRQTVQLVNSLPQLKAPRDFVLTPAMVSEKVIPFPVQQRPRVLKFLLPVLSAAASLLIVLVGLSMLLSSQMPQSATTGDVAPQPQTDIAALASATPLLTLDATLTNDGQLNQTMLATDELEQAAEDEIQSETESDDGTVMLMVVPSESPMDGDAEIAVGGAAMDSAEPQKTMSLMASSATALATSLPGVGQQSFEATMTVMGYYESSPVIVGTLSLTDIIPPASDVLPATLDPASATTLNEAETQAKMTAETPAAEELSSAAAQDIAPAGNVRMYSSTMGLALISVGVMIGITTLIVLIRLLP